jgi:hypothetical protein
MLTPTISNAVIVAVVGLAVVAVWRFIGRSVRRELHSVIQEVIHPELQRIHERIDAHMDSEEGDLKRLIDVLAHLSGEDPDDISSKIKGK